MSDELLGQTLHAPVAHHQRWQSHSLLSLACAKLKRRPPAPLAAPQTLHSDQLVEFWRIMRAVGAVKFQPGEAQRQQIERWSALKALKADLLKAEAGWSQVPLGARDQRLGRDEEIMGFTLEENADWQSGEVASRLLNLCDPVRREGAPHTVAASPPFSWCPAAAAS